MTLALDAPVAWRLDDETTPATEAMLDHVVTAGATVPTIWRFEVGNALQMAYRRQRITDTFRNHALARLRALPISVDSDGDTHAWATTMGISERSRLTLYDASYLELAQRRGLPLGCLDQAMRSAARALGISLFGAG